jgi:uncharacterized protein involved in exopolysaccharide biosynthesis
MQQGDNNNVERRTMNVEPVSDLEPDSSMSFLDFLEVILKRKWMIFSFTLAAAVISIVYSLMLPNIYTAKALILPSREDKGLASSMLAQFGGLAGVPGGALGGPTLLELYVTMLKSESIKDPIIDRFGLLKFYKKKFRSDAYAVLAAKTAISFNKKDGVITINVSDKNPKWAAELANAYVQELDKMTIRLNVTGEGKNRFFLERRLGEAKADLARAEEALKDFQ